MGVLSGGGWWQHTEQVVAPWAGAVEEQEPRCLEVVQGRDVVQKSWVAGPGLAEVVSLVFWCAKGGSEDSEPSLLGRECRVSDPFVKLGMDGLDGRVLPQRKQCWHEEVPLLATLGLLDNMGCVGVVVPHVCGGLGVEKPDEWQTSVCFGHGLEALKHAIAGDSVVGANPIDRMVRVGCCSASVVRACTTASVPARVERAYWCGRHAWWICLA